MKIQELVRDNISHSISTFVELVAEPVIEDKAKYNLTREMIIIGVMNALTDEMANAPDDDIEPLTKLFNDLLNESIRTKNERNKKASEVEAIFHDLIEEANIKGWGKEEIDKVLKERTAHLDCQVNIIVADDKTDKSKLTLLK